jgi:hypothetical protein
MTGAVMDAAADRASGRQSTRRRAFLAAAVVAVGAGVATYRILRA